MVFWANSILVENVVWGTEIQTRILTASYNHYKLTIHFSVYLKIALNRHCLHDHQTTIRLQSDPDKSESGRTDLLVNRFYLSKLLIMQKRLRWAQIFQQVADNWAELNDVGFYFGL